jgi:hypothetical protein
MSHYRYSGIIWKVELSSTKFMAKESATTIKSVGGTQQSIIFLSNVLPQHCGAI